MNSICSWSYSEERARSDVQRTARKVKEVGPKWQEGGQKQVEGKARRCQKRAYCFARAMR